MTTSSHHEVLFQFHLKQEKLPIVLNSLVTDSTFVEPWHTQRVFVTLLYPRGQELQASEGALGGSPMDGRWMCCLPIDSSSFYPWKDAFYISLSSGQGKSPCITIYNDCFEVHRPTNLKPTIYTLGSGFALFELNRMHSIICKFTRHRMAWNLCPHVLYLLMPMGARSA